MAGDALLRHVVTFGRVLREAGIEVGPGRLTDALRALDNVDLSRQEDVYFSLRQTDAQKALLDATVDGYQRVLTITQNRFNAGIAAKSDLLQAQTQLANARADQLGLVRQRSQLEHAIAVLVGSVAAATMTYIGHGRRTRTQPG